MLTTQGFQSIHTDGIDQRFHAVSSAIHFLHRGCARKWYYLPTHVSCRHYGHHASWKFRLIHVKLLIESQRVILLLQTLYDCFAGNLHSDAVILCAYRRRPLGVGHCKFEEVFMSCKLGHWFLGNFEISVWRNAVHFISALNILNPDPSVDNEFTRLFWFSSIIPQNWVQRCESHLSFSFVCALFLHSGNHHNVRRRDIFSSIW